jgi:hypothetical protein
MPLEMRAFIEKGDHLLERYEQGTETRTQIVRALKVSWLAPGIANDQYQSDQLLRANKQLRDQLNSTTVCDLARCWVLTDEQTKLSKVSKGLTLWQQEKTEWEKKEAEYQT